MIRTQIQLQADQHERLKALAARQSTSVARLIREAVERLLAAERRGEAWERCLSAVGSFRTEDGLSDVSSLHDAYLADDFER